MNADLHDREWDVFADPDFAPDPCDPESGPDLCLGRTDYDAWLRVRDTPAAWTLDEIAHRIVQRMRLEAAGEEREGTVYLEALGLSDLQVAHIAKIVAERSPKYRTIGRTVDDGSVGAGREAPR